MKHLQQINEFFGFGNPKFIIGNTYIHRPKSEKPYRMIYQGKTKDNTQEIFKREDNGQLLYFFPHYIKGEVFKNSKNLEPWYKNESKLNEETNYSEILKSIEGSNMFPKDLTDKYKIIKEKYPEWEHKDAQERLKRGRRN